VRHQAKAAAVGCVNPSRCGIGSERKVFKTHVLYDIPPTGIEEAAEIMSLSTRTIRRRISDGTIPAYQCGRRPIRIRLDELEAALRPIPCATRWQ
jgi:excisionase family DNA binding protein